VKSAITVSLVPESRGGPFVLWDDLLAAMKLAKSMNFHAVEIFAPGPEYFREVVFHDNTDKKMSVKQMAESQGLAIAAIGTGAGWVKHRLCLSDPDASKRQSALEFLKQMLSCAADIGAPMIIGSMQGRSFPGINLDQARAWLREGLEQLDQLASDLDASVLYEPLNRYETDLANTLETGCLLIEGLARTRLLADWFHMNIEEVDVAAAIRAAGKAIGHVHFADSNRRAVGFGHLNIEPIIKALREIDYQGYLSAEVFAWPDSSGAAKQTIEAYTRWVENGVAPRSK